jgi:glycine cleavage system H protein
LVEQIPPEAVVHLVSDDPTAHVEMVRWTDETGNSFVDWREEGDLFHFIIRKTS